jgi:sporulation protein YlmC with PRC-barrel domain
MMISRFVSSTALAGALALSVGAYAQTSGTQMQTPSNPSQHVQSGATVLLQESPNDYLARQDLIGTNVRNEQNEKIGDVEDVIFDRNGQIKGIVVGVGGFLGMGEKHVALAWNELQVRPPAERSGSAETSRTSTSSRHPTLVANVTKDQLKQAADFKRVSDVRRERRDMNNRTNSGINNRTNNGSYGTSNTAPRGTTQPSQ